MAQVSKHSYRFLLFFLVILCFFPAQAASQPEAVGEKAPVTDPLARPNVVVPILLYHRVNDITPNEYWVSTDEFEAQMKALVEHDYQAVFTKDMYDYMYGGGTLPPKPVIITFDDACEDLYTHAYPILMREGLRAEAFITTDAIGSSESDRQVSVLMGEPEIVSAAKHLIWPEIIEMASNGMVFGSHSKSHQDLTELNNAELESEIMDSKQALFSNAGITASSFAYPYGAGDDDPKIHQVLAEHGYTIGVGTMIGVEQTQSANPLALNRITIYGPGVARDPESKGVSTIYDPAHPDDYFLTKVAPDEAEVSYRKSQAFAIADKPDLAFPPIERAVELEPDNIEYLKFHATIANWVGRSDRAADSCERIVSLEPDNKEGLLNLARFSSWSGRLDRAASAYDEYLSKYPDEPEVYIDSVQTESWMGHYAKSLNRLEEYRERFGETKDYLQEKARVLAWAQRPEKAFELITPLLEEEPDNYEVNYSRTVALHYDNRPREAVESLETLYHLRPDPEETDDIRRFVVTPLRSFAEFGGRGYWDSDDLEIYTGWARAIYSLRPETQFGVGVQTDYLRVDKEEGLEPLDGDKHTWHHREWFEIYNRFSPEVAMDAYMGVADAEGKTRPTYGIGLDYQPEDNLGLRLERDYGFYLVSPRTVDVGVRRGRNSFMLNWEPHLLYTVVGELGYSDYSDKNESWEAMLAPRRAFVRSENLNLDLGVRGQWFGFKDDLDHGYYDPTLYQSYMATSFWYWKISDNDGVSVTLDAGVIRDDDMSSFDFGWGGSIEGTFGLYRDVMLRIGGSGFNYYRREGGTYEAYLAHVIVTIRF